MLAANDTTGVETASPLAARARALRPLLEANAAECERTRRICGENLRALEDADLLRVMLPGRVGGLGASMAAQLEVSAELAKGCASTAGCRRC